MSSALLSEKRPVVPEAEEVLPQTWTLPADREATAPPEARGLTRDGVRLMVSDLAADRVTHATFREIGDFLAPGDLLVVNTSGTRASALPAMRRRDRLALRLHLSTHKGGDRWVIELRQPIGGKPSGSETRPFLSAAQGEMFDLPDGGRVRLIAPHAVGALPGSVRLWDAAIRFPGGEAEYLARYAAPIRYGYVSEPWPLPYYQTVFATETGSAEMPSAGRAFMHELVTYLIARGIEFAPLMLHTGVASLEDHEPPYEEWFRVPAETARRVNAAHVQGRRTIAVGTTAVRALETAVGEDGFVDPAEGWTDLVITPERGMRVVNGLLTGLHEPRATHLWMLEALAGRIHLRRAYAEALAREYLWHEFGDLHLLLAPPRD
jgi:S-adenosylmethionine:tRNA ribosyltransferase-isomerase